jgi:CheY-like chemotaxis protein
VSKILIVDDDAIITDLMKALLIMEGHEPVTVNDSMEAVELAAAVKPDLITLDLMMPGLTGFELCELLHQDPRFADIPIMVISARDDQGSKERAIQAGAKAFLTKPFGVEELTQYISDLTHT